MISIIRNVSLGAFCMGVVYFGSFQLCVMCSNDCVEREIA